MRHLIAVAIGLFAGASLAEAPQNMPPVYLNGRLIGFAIMKDGRSYLPVRALSESLGAGVSFNGGAIDISAGWIGTGAPETPSLPDPLIALGDETWHWCEKGEGIWRVRSFVISSLKITGELEAVRAPWTETKENKGKPSIAQFTFHLYGANRGLIGREDVDVARVWNTPGVYTVECTLPYDVREKVAFVKVVHRGGYFYKD